jgi:uncharacterized protein YcbX
MIIDASGGFLTQREFPAMALIVPELEQGALRVMAPGMPELGVRTDLYGPRRDAVIWNDTCEVIDQGAAAAEWFTAYLGTECRLACWAPDVVRQVDPTRAPPGAEVGFADGFPFLLALESSLADLNARLPEPLPMERFRPNLVVDGVAPFEEDHWKSFGINGITFSVVKPCARCAITTVDQRTGRVAKEPLRTLATFRRVQGEGVMFGQNVLHNRGGTLEVGMVVDVERG